MGRSGPLRMAGHLKAVSGPDDAQTVADIVPPVGPDKPQSVADDATLSQLWDEVVPQIEASGLLTSADALSIAMMLRHYRAACVAADQVGDDVVLDDNVHGGTKRNPGLVVFNQQSAQFLEYAKVLGMVWMSRARTAAPKDASGADTNPFDQPAAATG